MMEFRTSLSRFLLITSLQITIISPATLAWASYHSSEEPAVNQEAQKTPDDVDTDALPPINLSDIDLAPIEGFTDEAAYQESQTNYTEELVEQARQSSDLTKQAELWLVAANLTLAHNLEPACTRVLLRLPAKRHIDKSASQMLDAVDEYLGHTSEIVSQIKDAQPAGDAAWLAQTTMKVRVLKAFSDAMRAIILFDQIEDVTRTMRSAASELAVWMEDDDEQIAAAAVLWYAVLRGHEFRLAPAMLVLPLATEELSRRALPFAFFSRMQRCLIMADHGRYATSLALLTKIEDRCEGWFTSDIDRADALRAVSVAETEVLRLWRDSLIEPSQNQSRLWCDQKLAEILKDRFQAPSHTVLRLRPAVPLVASATQLQHRQPEETP